MQICIDYDSFCPIQIWGKGKQQSICLFQGKLLVKEDATQILLVKELHGHIYSSITLCTITLCRMKKYMNQIKVEISIQQGIWNQQNNNNNNKKTLLFFCSK